MKTLTIPQGYEFSHISENEIILKQVVPVYPMSVDDIENRQYNFNVAGEIFISKYDKNITNLSKTDMVNAIVALIQLVELRDAWNRVDGFVVDWTDNGQIKYCIQFIEGKKYISRRSIVSVPLFLGSEETAQKFLTKFTTLIETAKELL